MFDDVLEIKSNYKKLINKQIPYTVNTYYEYPYSEWPESCREGNHEWESGFFTAGRNVDSMVIGIILRCRQCMHRELFKDVPEEWHKSFLRLFGVKI